MYAVVGCGDCTALWIIEGRPDTTRCPRCGSRHDVGSLRRFAETPDPDEARQARSALLARRQDAGEAFEDLPPFEALSDRAASAGPDDETVLESSGVDPEAVADAAERAERGPAASRSGRLDVVRAAVRDLDAPDERAVAEYAAERGVDEQFVRTALARLVRRGVATEHRGTYRLV